MRTDFEKFVDDMRELYNHACELLANNDWISVCEEQEDCVICYVATPIEVFVDYIYEDIYGDIDCGNTMRFTFHEDNHGVVTVCSCHKCNQPGCFFTNEKYECQFAIEC